MKKKRSKYAPSEKMVEGSAYRGAAGEYLVMGQLLLREFDAALVAVDSGTDIVAEKSGKLTRIQVKLRRLGGDIQTSFNVSEKNVNKASRPDYYVFGILHERDLTVDYLILSRQRYDLFCKKKFIYYLQGRHYSATVRLREGKWRLGGKKRGVDVTEIMNDWTQIK